MPCVTMRCSLMGSAGPSSAPGRNRVDVRTALGVALALRQQGCEVDAARWFERNRAACGTAGLYCEEYDVAERQMRGNLPQAFVHALMLECAARLGSPWKPE